MPLIKQIHNAVITGDLVDPFTQQDFENWMKKKKILKDDGKEYAESSIKAILYNSRKRRKPTKNRNIQVLYCKSDKYNIRYYSFNE